MPRNVLFRSLAVLGLVLAATAHGQAQSPKADAKPLLENDRMRASEVVFKPGVQTPISSRGNRFVYALTDGALVFSPPGKTPYELSFKAGEALWLPSESTATLNDGDKDVRALVVEFKEGAKPAAKTKAKGKGRVQLKLQVRGKGADKAAAAKPTTQAAKRD